MANLNRNLKTTLPKIYKSRTCKTKTTSSSSRLRRASIISNTVLSNQCTQRKNVELLKQINIKEAAPTRFGLQGNHHQGATVSTWIQLHIWFNVVT